jgi:hypothetical protein
MKTLLPTDPRSDRKMPRWEERGQENSFSANYDVSSNDPFGSRSEPGKYLTASTLQLPPGEAPEGRASGVQATTQKVLSECEL